MASQKEVKNRIASVKNINKITRAMEMVAAARLRRSEQRIADLRPYSEGMRKLTRIASAHTTGVPRIPVLVERPFGRPGDVAKVTDGDAAIACEGDVDGVGCGDHGAFLRGRSLYYPDKFTLSIKSG